MRRIPRLPSASGLSRSSSLPKAFNAPQLASIAQTRHDQSTARASTFARCNRAWPATRNPVPQRGYSSNSSTNAQDDVETGLTAQMVDGENLVEPAEAGAALVVPGGVVDAPNPDEVTDMAYVPAESGAKLEEVGGLKDYWEDDSRWDASFVPLGFGPREKITDPAVLEVATRRAVVEAIVFRDSADALATDLRLTGSWGLGGAEDAAAALGVQITVADDGAVTLAGDVSRVVSGLADRSSAEANAASGGVMDVGEARELIGTWDQSWKDISLEDNGLKFAVVKRIQQLTGHLIPSAKLPLISDVQTLLAVLVRPPKSKKLAEEIQARGELQALPNVAVHQRRITSVDKQKRVGRWKVIVQELEKRDLPAFGSGDYGRYVETKWVRAAEIALRSAKAEKARAKKKERSG